MTAALSGHRDRAETAINSRKARTITAAEDPDHPADRKGGGVDPAASPRPPRLTTPWSRAGPGGSPRSRIVFYKGPGLGAVWGAHSESGVMTAASVGHG